MKEECQLFTKGNEENVIAKRAIRLFLERWRRKYGKSVRHWFVTELGEKNDRLHLHGIIFTEKKESEIKERWGYGNIWIGKFVNRKTINYVTKYMTKLDEKHKEYKAIILTSAGIGKGYIKSKNAERNKYKKEKTIEYYETREGVRLGLPIYYRNKIYSEEEREKLWIEKLDKGEIYIGGEKVKSRKPKQIIKMREYYREKSIKRGYVS